MKLIVSTFLVYKVKKCLLKSGKVKPCITHIRTTFFTSMSQFPTIQMSNKRFIPIYEFFPAYRTFFLWVIKNHFSVLKFSCLSAIYILIILYLYKFTLYNWHHQPYTQFNIFIPRPLIGLTTVPKSLMIFPYSTTKFTASDKCKFSEISSCLQTSLSR